MGRKFFIAILSLTVLYGAYLWGVPAILNNPANLQKIETAIKQTTGFNLYLASPNIKTGIIPSVSFKADNLSILNDDNSKALDINNFEINVRLLPLLLKKINIQKLSLDNASANFVYDGKFKLGQYELLNLPQTSFGINPKNVEIKAFDINFENKKLSKNISLKGKTYTDKQIKTIIDINDNTKISANINTSNNTLIIKDLQIKGKNISGFAKGRITKLNAKYPDLDLKIGLNKSRAEDILSIIPDIPNLSPDMDIIKIKETGFWGDASANLEIKGKADKPNVYGNVLIKNAYAVKQIPNAEKATIKIGFKGDKLNLDVLVPTSPTEKVIVKGPINLYGNKSADLNITSTENVDLKTAQIVLNPLHEIFYFDLGPVPIMDIKGQGGINLRVTGTRQNPYAWGEFRFKNATVSFLDIHNMEIHNGSGSLKFDNQNTFFESKTAILNGKPISIKGTCTLLGVLNFDVIANYQDLGNMINIIQKSPMLKEVQELVKPIEKASGPANLTLNLTGQVKNVNDIVFNKNLFAKGKIELFGNTVKLKDTPTYIKNTKGNINFNNLNADFDLKSNLNSSDISIFGKLKNNTCDLKISAQNYTIADMLNKFPYDLSSIKTSFQAKYNGKIDDIEYDKLFIKGKIFSNRGAKCPIIVNNSDYELNKSNLKISKLEGTFNGSPYNFNLTGQRIFSNNRILNGYGKISSLELNSLNEFFKLLPKEISNQLKNLKFLNGKTDLTARIRNNNLNVYTELNNIALNFDDINIEINSGNILLHNNALNINKINAVVSNMPVFADGKIYNINKNPNLNLYINAKPTQDFIEHIYNKKSIYPIKLKGDIILSSKLNGYLNALNAKSVMDINENSSLYYMGATIGDVENPVKINADTTYSANKIKVNNLKYDKIINSQNNKPFIKTQLNASGILSLLNDGNIGFNNFRIKTENPTDAKIFNIIFGKPFMKQGIFTSDIILNGTSVNPKIFGKLNITSVDIPFFDSTVRDLNFDFKKDKIYFSSKGKVLTNEVLLDAVAHNNLTPPYIIDNIKLEMADLNINKITETLNDIEAESARTLSVKQNTTIPFDITQLIIKKAEIFADKIQVRNINADKFSANLKITDKKIADVQNFKFNIAQGIVDGNFNYDLLKHKSNLDIHLNNANASIMSEALFDLKGQVYGSINGDFKLACIGNSNDECFKTLSGGGTFKIADGRMPKLGSLEYLLKAGNIWKGGIAGFSINSLIDLVTPLKTGEFESISGDVHISQGIADEINIYSKGNDLNMYMTGSYNILSSVADMKIFGSLSKNITTVFGKIKNASLSTLFNTIPGVNDETEKLLLQTEISKIPSIKDVTDIYRIFTVEINGDINGTNYVKSFRWVK